MSQLAKREIREENYRDLGFNGDINRTISSKDVKINKDKYPIFKRGFDIFFSIILLLVTSPIILVSMAIVFLQDFKNPIFVQYRVGLNNEEFKLYKIRSMIENAEKDGYKWAATNDSRVTAFGRFIRKTRIDELPQLINVLKGDMSLIGPRPELEFFYRKFEKEIPEFRARLLVKPGLTGWAQVNGGYDLSPSEKLALDLYYVDNLGMKIEMKIFFKTIKIILTGNGAR